MIRIGQGFDVHAFAENRKLIIGGVEIPYSSGLAGHSDADVLLHAIMDAMLGALAKGDIGIHFPDSDDTYNNADSMTLFGKVYKMVQAEGYMLGNLDCTIIAQEPKMKPYIPQMRKKIADKCLVKADKISIKATTTENLGFTGRKEGIAAQAIVMLVEQGA